MEFFLNSYVDEFEDVSCHTRAPTGLSQMLNLQQRLSRKPHNHNRSSAFGMGQHGT